MKAVCIPLLQVLGPIVLVTLDPNIITDAIVIVVNPSDSWKENFDRDLRVEAPYNRFHPRTMMVWQIPKPIIDSSWKGKLISLMARLMIFICRKLLRMTWLIGTYISSSKLFNYCFPIDYRQQMRIKLEDVHQKHHQTVLEFVYELQELFSMVGNTPPEMKVVKLWYNLKAPIQRALWRDGLHPDTSTWDEVVARAEIFEVAENVLRPSERRSQFHTSRDHDNTSNKNKPKHAALSSCSMAYTSKDCYDFKRFK